MTVKCIIAGCVIATFLPLAAWADFDLPVRQGTITSAIGWRLDPFGSGRRTFHRGIDIAVPVGTPVRATRTGKVIFSGNRGGYGATVEIEHSNGDRTLYGHNSVLTATAGQTVAVGTVIALAGSSGRSTGPHVHYEVLLSGTPRVEAASDDAPEISFSRSSTVRMTQEQKLDEAMNSIFRRIRESSVAPTPLGGG